MKQTKAGHYLSNYCRFILSHLKYYVSEFFFFFVYLVHWWYMTDIFLLDLFIYCLLQLLYSGLNKNLAGDIFANISFVVTSAMRRMKEEEQGGFSKREIRQMIEGCGGNVVEDFTVSASFFFSFFFNITFCF